MAKRNPNGYGCIKKMSGNRKRPYSAVITMHDSLGVAHQTSIGYAETWEEANALLVSWHHRPWNIGRDQLSLDELYTLWDKTKRPQLGKENQNSLKTAYKWLKPCYGMRYRSIKSPHMQQCIDACPKSYSTKAAIKNLWLHLDRLAFELDIIDKRYSEIISVNTPVPVSDKSPFTRSEIDLLWKKSDDDDNVKIILLFIYTGFRITELLDIKKDQVDLKEGTICGGSKTPAGKGRIVPIHSRILPIVQYFFNKNREYLLENPKTGHAFNSSSFRTNYWYKTLFLLGLDHTPHEARHTFETELDAKKANRRCIDLMMGHKSKDVGNRVYNHKTIKQLKEAIALME